MVQVTSEGKEEQEEKEDEEEQHHPKLHNDYPINAT